MHDLGVERRGSMAVRAKQVVAHLLGHDAPALTGEHVHNGLGTDDLAHRGNKRREADLGADARNFGHDVFQTVSRMLHLKLAHKVAHHAAGDLMLIDLHMNERGDAALIMAATTHLLPVVRNLKEEVQIKTRIESRLLEGSGDHLDCGMGITRSKRCGSRVDNRGSGLGALDKARGSHTANVVAMQMDGHINGGAKSVHELLGAIRREKTRHIFDADGVGTELRKLASIVHIGIKRMYRACRIRDSGLEMCSASFHGTGAISHVVDVVQGIENTKDINTVLVRTGNKTVDDIRRIMAIANEVLTAHKHRKRRLGRSSLNLAKTVPRVLVKKPQARIERGAAPRLDGPISNFIHLGQDGKDIADSHARRPERLLSVADGRVHHAEAFISHVNPNLRALGIKRAG